MNKELLKKLQVLAGGSHYPTINPEIQASFAKLILDECVAAIRDIDKTHCYTTHDLGVVQAGAEAAVKSIEKKFNYHAVPNYEKSDPLSGISRSRFSNP